MLDAFKDDLTEDERRELLGGEFERRGADPLLYQAVVTLEAEAPKVTMLDSKNMYLQERLDGG
jgi:hypothetical protein